MKLKILFIDPLKDRGGQEKFCTTLAKSISDSQKYEVSFVTDESDISLEILEDFKLDKNIIRLPFKSKYNILSAINLHKACIDHGADIVFYNGDRAAHYYKISSLFFKKSFKTIFCSHLLIEDETREYNFILKKIYSFVYWIRIEIFDKIITINSNYLTCFRSRVSRPDKVIAINNAVKFIPPNIDKHLAAKKTRVDGKYVIGFIGRLESQKGVELLIKAYSKFCKRISNSVLLIIGSGSIEKSLKRLVISEGIEDSVIFAGYIQDIHNYYQLIDVIVFPSIYEGLPLTVIEAMSHEKCIVASNIHGHTLALINFKNSILFESHSQGSLLESLDGVYMKKYPCQDFSENARIDFDKKFNWDILVGKYTSLLDSI
jgi:glycosyltransferase involved in cell wall biosynthesis